MKKLSLGGVLPIILVIACIGGGYFFSYAQWVSYSQSQETIKLAQAKLDAVKQAESDLDGFLTAYRRSLDSQPLVDRALPPGNAALPRILALTEELALASGLGISSINVRQEETLLAKDPNSVDFADVDIQVSGTFPELSNFFLLLEQNLRISDVQSVTVQTGEEANLQYSLLVRMYYQN